MTWQAGHGDDEQKKKIKGKGQGAEDGLRAGLAGQDARVGQAMVR